MATLTYSLITGRPVRANRSLSVAFTGLLDLQVLLGIGLLFVRPFFGALIGHLTMMLLAVATVHGASIWARRSSEKMRALAIRLGGVVAAFLCIVLGILAIGRSVV